nr:tetraspanin [Hymenolepis microstoma]
MIKMYAAFTCIMLLTELCVAIAAAILRANLEMYAESRINDLISDYENDKKAETQLNQIQEQYGCCGANSVVDYHAKNMSTPSSCCSSLPCADTNIYPKGCVFVLKEYFDHKMLMMSISSFVASVGNAFGFAFSLLFISELRRYTQIK